MALRRLALCSSISGRKFVAESSQFKQFKAGIRYVSVQSKDDPIINKYLDTYDIESLRRPERLTPAMVCQALFTMCRRQQKTTDHQHLESIEQKHFDILYERAHRLSMILSTGKLINLVHSLNQLNNYIQDTTILRELERKALTKLETLSFCQTATLVKSYKIYSSLDVTQIQLFEGAKSKLIQLIEQDKPSFDNLILALQMVADDTLPKSILDQIEDKLLGELSFFSSKIQEYGHENIVDKYDDHILYTSDNLSQASSGITYNNLSKLFVLLAHNGRRPVPLLKIASELFENIPNSESIDPSHLVETLNALSAMQYPNHRVLNRILKDLVDAEFAKHLRANNLTTLLTTLSKLQWIHKDILRDCLLRVNSDNNGLRPKDLAAFICTCALLNYKHDDLESSYKTKIADKVKLSSLNSSSNWLKYVWSLAILDLATETDIMSVLNEDFYKSLKSERQQYTPLDSETTVLVDTLKLLNLQSLAIHSMGLKNVRLESLDVDFKTNNPIAQHMFTTGIIKALKRFLPVTCIETDVATPHGFKIDILLITNNKFEPIPHNDPKKKEYLSNGYFNCALMVTGVKESICNQPDSPTGSKIIQEKILKSLGYNVVFIPQPIFGSMKPGLDLTIALKKHIAEAISR